MASETTPLRPELRASRGESEDNLEATAQLDEKRFTDLPSENVRSKKGSWRLVIISAALFLVAYLTLLDVALDGFWPTTSDTSTATTIEGRVNTILSETPLIDGHNDLAILIRYLFNNHIYAENFTKPFEGGGFPYHVDIPRLREGKNGGAFWSAFVPCPKDGADFADENYSEAIDQTLRQIDVLHRLRDSYPDTFSVPPTSRTALQYFLQNQLISPLGIEGLHQIGRSPSLLRLYHSLGVRYATLTHNCHNIFADAALLEDNSENPTRGAVYVAPPLWGGINPGPGRALIREMNRLGMIVDLAHVSHATMLDVLTGFNSTDPTIPLEYPAAHTSEWSGSAAPIIFSHSSAYALCPHPRNVPDHVLQHVARTSSLVMVNFSPDFIACTATSSASEAETPSLPKPDPAHATLARVAEHVLHIANVTGSFDHVGLGSDFDGIFSTPRGLEDVSKFPALVAELLRRGVSDEDAKKVVGGNLLRVWRRVEEVGERMRGEEGVLPLEDGDLGL